MRVCAHVPVRSCERRSHTDNAHAGRRHGRRRHDRPKYKTASTKYAQGGSGGRATETRSASDCAAVLSLEHGKVSSDRRRGVTSIFVHARSCRGVLHAFDTSPAPRVGTGCARPLMLTFSIIRMDTSHASPFICSLLKTTYVALSRAAKRPGLLLAMYDYRYSCTQLPTQLRTCTTTFLTAVAGTAACSQIAPNVPASKAPRIRRTTRSLKPTRSPLPTSATRSKCHHAGFKMRKPTLSAHAAGRHSTAVDHAAQLPAQRGPWKAHGSHAQHPVHCTQRGGMALAH